MSMVEEKEKKKASGFQPCIECSSLIPACDTHSTCLKCLGPQHVPKNCERCRFMGTRSMRNRVHQYRELFGGPSLSPTPLGSSGHRRGAESDLAHGATQSLEYLKEQEVYLGEEPILLNLPASTSTGSVICGSSGKSAVKKQKPSGIASLKEHDLDTDTPRTILKNILQNEPEVSLLAPQKSYIEPERMELEISEIPQSSFLSPSLGTPVVKQSIKKPGLLRRKKQRIAVSEEDFVKGVNQNVQQLKTGKTEETHQGESNETTSAPPNLSNNASSFSLSLTTSLKKQSVKKPGLRRRRKMHRIVSEEDFINGVNQNIQQLKTGKTEETHQGESNETISAPPNLSNNASSSSSLFLTTSLQKQSIKKPGLHRRKKTHRVVSEEDFIKGVNQNILQLKNFQENVPDLQAISVDKWALQSSTILNNTGKELSNTELYDHPHLMPENKNSSSVSTFKSPEAVVSLTAERKPTDELQTKQPGADEQCDMGAEVENSLGNKVMELEEDGEYIEKNAGIRETAVKGKSIAPHANRLLEYRKDNNLSYDQTGDEHSNQGPAPEDDIMEQNINCQS
ncbi:uncharacterized protein LOC102352203 [Latimeria chalumnae]|uniref:uncharacterized protein LOC102352203 n=1 Tax=Latimeria chalumnae TaxID=7897 RepID=UPI00313F3A3A